MKFTDNHKTLNYIRKPSTQKQERKVNTHKKIDVLSQKIRIVLYNFGTKKISGVHQETLDYTKSN